jgi:hypothetical protein
MKPIATNQEILLYIGSTFSNREFSKPGKQNNRLATDYPWEELERACWAGMLFELLPELSIDAFARNKTCIWNILSGEHSLLINQGTDPNPAEAVFSIDPRLFLTATGFN